jgi:hypothetical protein
MFVPEPVLITWSGSLVIVHAPEEGKPLKATLAVGTEQLG